MPPYVTTGSDWARAASAAARVKRAAILVLLLFGFTVWNLIFHWHHVADSRDYLYRQSLHQQGLGPAVDARDIMGGSIRVGVIDATAWSVALTGAGVAVVEYVFRRESRKVRQSGRPDA